MAPLLVTCKGKAYSAHAVSLLIAPARAITSHARTGAQMSEDWQEDQRIELERYQEQQRQEEERFEEQRLEQERLDEEQRLEQERYQEQERQEQQ